MRSRRRRQNGMSPLEVRRDLTEKKNVRKGERKKRNRKKKEGKK